MSELMLIVYGSVLTLGVEAQDIDLVIPEFTDQRVYEAEVDLAVYEKIAHTLSKPVDLFFTTMQGLNTAAVYHPDNPKWIFRQAFAGKCHFDGCVDNVLRRPDRESACSWQNDKSTTGSPMDAGD